MPGFFALSVNPNKYRGKFLKELFWETFYHQHLGEDYSGITTCDGEGIKLRTHRGLFRPNFSGDLGGLEGTEGIGYCGDNREPVWSESRLGDCAACFIGNLINHDGLAEDLKGSGYSFFWGGKDIELIIKLMARGEDRISGIRIMTEAIEGAYALAILTMEGIYVVCSPDGHWPLVVGEKEGAVAVASDPSGFSNFDFRRVRDIKPGEIALMKNGILETKAMMPAENPQICSFVWIYTNFPAAVFKEISASSVRKKLTAILARRDIEKGFIPDVVIPVPDSGNFPAMGYHQEFIREFNRQAAKGSITLPKIPFYDQGILRYQYAGRSYPQLNSEERDLEAHIKQLAGGEDYSGLVVAVCDDSIRRGTQIRRNLVPKLRSMGIKEIHLRIANPESYSYCPWGKTVQKGELIASQIPLKEDRIKFFGVESLEHPTVQELAGAIGLPLEEICVDCGFPLSKQK